MKNGIALLRVSTNQQDVEYQAKEIEKECDYRNIHLIKTFEEKISGSKKNRDSLKKMFKYIESIDDKIDYVIVTELSRVGRTNEVLTVLDNLAALGICFISIKENIRTIKEDGTIDSGAKLLVNVLQGISEYELSSISFRSKAGLDNSVVSNNVWVNGNPPYGYSIENKHLVINEEEAKIVKEIFNLISNHKWGFTKVSNHLNREGIKTRFNKEWYEHTIRAIAKNSIYIGKRKWQRDKGKQTEKTYIVDCPELQIIDNIVFDQVQKNKFKLKNVPKTEKVYDYLFDEQIINCGVCGKHYIAQLNKSNGHKVYRCYSTKYGKGCGSGSLNMDYLDYYVQQIVLGKYSDNFNSEVDKNDELITLKKDKELNESELTKIDAKIKRLKDSFFDLLIDEDDFKARILKLNQSKELIENELLTINKKIDNFTSVKFISDNYYYQQDADGKLKMIELKLDKEILHKIINKMVVYPDYINIHFNNNQTFRLPTPPKRWNLSKIDKYDILGD